jgi:hypothetical protein
MRVIGASSEVEMVAFLGDDLASDRFPAGASGVESPAEHAIHTAQPGGSRKRSGVRPHADRRLPRRGARRGCHWPQVIVVGDAGPEAILTETVLVGGVSPRVARWSGYPDG